MDIYYGQLKNKKKSGFGRLITNHGEENQEVYYGEFKNDKKYGHGIIYYNSNNEKQSVCGLFKKNLMKSIMIKFRNGNGYFGDLNTKRSDDNNFGIYFINNGGLNNGGYEIGTYDNNILINNVGWIYNKNHELIHYGAFNSGLKIDNFFVTDNPNGWLHWLDRAKKNADKGRDDCNIANQILDKIKNSIPSDDSELLDYYIENEVIDYPALQEIIQ